jgi:phage shock protein PspC (stress-responsive transcriptional regulator)
MKKTLQIHIGGRHFHMDEDGYHKLNHYLESLKSHFAAEGESGKEIVEDIEQRIAELLENKITLNKQAVSLDDVNEIIATLGRVEDFVYNSQSDNQQEDDYRDRRNYRRFYRDSDNGYIGGVASGLGEYLDIDPLWLRLAFIALVFLKGLGILIYVILWIVVPRARSTAEKLQMKGMPVNLSTIKESVNAEYDKVKSGFDGLRNSTTADRTRNALENIMRAVGLFMAAVFKFIIGAIGILFLIIGSVFLAGLIMVLLGVSNIFNHIHIWNGVDFPNVSHLFASTGNYHIVLICLVILILVPVVALIYGGIKILFNIRTKHPVLRAFTLTAWILALILFVTLILANSSNYAVGATGTRSSFIETNKYPRIYIDVRDNTEDKSITEYRVFDRRFNYSKADESLYDEVQLSIEPSEDKRMHLTVNRQVKNIGMKDSNRYIDRIEYQWDQEDSVLYLNKYFSTDDDDFWLFSDVEIRLRVPEDQVIVISHKTCDILESYQYDQYCNEGSLADKKAVMSSDGTLLPVK